MICDCGCEIKFYGEKAPSVYKCFKCGNKVKFETVEVPAVVETPEERPPLKKRSRPKGTKRKA